MWPRRDPVLPGQRSVWDFPRPPAVVPNTRALQVVFAGEVIAQTNGGFAVLETSHPPTYYLPQYDCRMDFLVPGEGESHCEWKGLARYYDALVEGERYPKIAWSYADPTPGFARIRGHLAFYLPALDAGYVDEERAEPQPGGFYGGWITPDLAGPFKGAPGSWGW